MNSSLSQHKSNHYQYNPIKMHVSPPSVMTQKQNSFVNPREDNYRHGYKHSNIFQSKSPIKKEFQTIIRADSAKHLQNRHRNSNFGENLPCQNYQTEKTI